MKSITLTAIDVGTYEILGAVARKDFKTGQVEVLARSQCSCLGVRNGEVVKPQQVGFAINKIREELADKSGQKIKEVFANISGRRIFSRFSQGLVSVSRADQKISKEDVQRVLRAAQAINLSYNKDILTALPQGFMIDGENDVREPIGLQGIRLEAKVLLVCYFAPVLDSLQKAFSEANLDVVEFYPSPLAAARAVLDQEQKEVGAALLDIGAGTTSLAVFEKGDLKDFTVLPVGAANITNDIALGLRTEIRTAEKIKKEFVNLLRRGRVAGDKIKIAEKDLCFSKSSLSGIVQARLCQVFSETQKALKKISYHEHLPAGIVLTGGGANLPGLSEFAKQKFKLPCRLGNTKEIPALDEPRLSVLSGLLLWGFDSASNEEGVSFRVKKEDLSDKFKRLFRAFLP